MERVPISLRNRGQKVLLRTGEFHRRFESGHWRSARAKTTLVAAGLNSIGIITGGGMGRLIAHWILHGRADVDITGMNIDRFHRYQSNPEYRRVRTVESRWEWCISVTIRPAR